MKELQNKINKHIDQEGLIFEKLISPAVSGFFTHQNAVYDNRIAHSYKEALELSSQGYTLKGDINYGVFLINAIMSK